MNNRTDLPSCKECGKTTRHDFDGYCMDCADENGISDVFPENERQENLTILTQRRFTPEEKKENLKKMGVYLKQYGDEGKPVLPILVRKN